MGTALPKKHSACDWAGSGSWSSHLNCAPQQSDLRPLPAWGTLSQWAQGAPGQGWPWLTDRVLLRGLLQHLGRDPALSARDPGAEAEALSSSLKLLAKAEVGDDGADLPVAIRDRDEDVTGLQVTVHCK